MKDLTGTRFGRLTAISATAQRYRGSVIWECKCDCGNTVYVSSTSLLTGNTHSCGCLQKEAIAKMAQNHSLDLSGQRFGRLVAMRATDQRKNHKVVWECKCDCGNMVYIQSSLLKNGHTISCGCLHDLTGQRFGRLMALRATDQRKRSNVVWECKCDCGNTVYVQSTLLKNGHTQSCGCLYNLTGQRFGRLMALRATDERRNNKVVWECKCDCGNTVYVQSTLLRNGHTQSCGCLWKEHVEKEAQKRIADLTGQRFGRLVALRATDERRNNKVVWECKCDCGNTVYVQSTLLKNGRTQSCGCLRRENMIANRTQKLPKSCTNE